jgi:hypothetical protein
MGLGGKLHRRGRSTQRRLLSRWFKSFKTFKPFKSIPDVFTVLNNWNVWNDWNARRAIICGSVVNIFSL